MTTEGYPGYPELMANDLLSLLNLKSLAASAAKAAAARELTDTKVGEVKCRVLEITLPASAIVDHPGGEFEETEIELGPVLLRIWIGRDDGLIHKLQGTVIIVEPVEGFEDEGDGEEEE